MTKERSCVRRTETSNSAKSKSWCGRTIEGDEWHFTSAEGAAKNGAIGGLRLVCGLCRGTIVDALNNEGRELIGERREVL